MTSMNSESIRNYFLILTVVLVLSAVLVASLFLGDDKERKEHENARLRIGYLPIAASLPLFVAIEDGLLPYQDADIELIPFASGNELAVAASSGRIDVAVSCAISTMLDAQAVRPSNFRVFLLNGYSESGSNGKPTDYLIARGGIRTIDELHGKKVAFFPGSVSRVFAQLCLPAHGIKFSDIDYIEMPPASWAPALANKDIDAVAAIEPFATKILDSKDVVVLVEGFFSTVIPDVPISGTWINCGTLNDDQQLQVTIAFEKAVSKIIENPKDASKLLSTYTKIEPDVASRIGLNTWKMSSDPQARDSAVNFIQAVQEHQLVRQPRSDEYWLWNQ